MRQLLAPVVVSGDRKWRGVSAVARYRYTEQAEYGVGSTEFAIVAGRLTRSALPCALRPACPAPPWRTLSHDPLCCIIIHT